MRNGTYICGYVRNCYKIGTSFLDHPKQLASFMSTSCLNRFLGAFLEPLGYPNLPATTAGLWSPGWGCWVLLSRLLDDSILKTSRACQPPQNRTSPSKRGIWTCSRFTREYTWFWRDGKNVSTRIGILLNSRWLSQKKSAKHWNLVFLFGSRERFFFFFKQRNLWSSSVWSERFAVCINIDNRFSSFKRLLYMIVYPYVYIYIYAYMNT